MVVVISCALATLCLAIVFRAVVLHVHPANEFRHAHEWDMLVLPIFAGLGGLFTAIALSAWRRWSWWRRLAVVVLGPILGIAAFFLLAYVRYSLLGDA
jgi:H+/Cl- antiporter ClcA